MFDFDLPEDLSWREARIPKPKKPGEFRKIAIPNAELMQTQRMLLYEYLGKSEALQASPFAHGFVPSRSTITGVRKLTRTARVIVCMDAKDFFDTFPVEVVRRRMIKQGVRATLVDKILKACTYNGHLPQGGPCSPFLTNVGMYDADCCIAAYAKKHHFTYIRYADDLVFSLDDDAPYDDSATDADGHKVRPSYKWLFVGVGKILNGILGIELNRRKCHSVHITSNAKRRVLGIVIRKDGGGYNAPIEMRKMARSMLCNLHWKIRHQGGVPMPEDFSRWARIKGYAAYFDGLRYGGDGMAGSADPVLQEKYWKYLEKKCQRKR